MCPHQPRITQRVQDKTNRNSIHRYPQQHATDVHSVVLSDSYRGSAASAESWDYRSYRSRLYGYSQALSRTPQVPWMLAIDVLETQRKRSRNASQIIWSFWSQKMWQFSNISNKSPISPIPVIQEQSYDIWCTRLCLVSLCLGVCLCWSPDVARGHYQVNDGRCTESLAHDFSELQARRAIDDAFDCASRHSNRDFSQRLLTETSHRDFSQCWNGLRDQPIPRVLRMNPWRLSTSKLCLRDL